ncbi:MAG: hypothetical protein J7K35_06935 [Syntrophobacterales bacterium]|nr:hypothetical protein [Syntrophobacterales bacterium]
MKTIRLIEEVAPEQGIAKEEIKNGIWNSPPTELGQGRYLLNGRGIENADFSHLRKNGLIWYWDKDFLEDCDMFYVSPGWRMKVGAIDYLRSQGYNVEINTLKDQKDEAEKRKVEAQRKKREEVARRERATQKYQTEIAEYEKWLGNPEYREPEKGRSYLQEFENNSFRKCHNRQ